MQKYPPAATHALNSNTQHGCTESCQLSEPQNADFHAADCSSACTQQQAHTVSAALPVNAPVLYISNFLLLFVLPNNSL